MLSPEDISKVEQRKLKFIGIWVTALIFWYLYKDVRRVIVNKRGWEDA